MSQQSESKHLMSAVRFHTFGEPEEVLGQEEVPVPQPGSGRIRVHVRACGLNPADWALCRGFMPGDMPRGIGLELSGTVDEIGPDVHDVEVGDEVFGTVDFVGYPSAGVADYAILGKWALIPDSMSFQRAAAISMAADTATLTLDFLGIGPGQTVVIHGAGTTTGYAAVQIALLKGATVVATAGETYSARLAAFGAKVTAYGSGMVERVLALAERVPDVIVDMSPPNGVLPDLLAIAEGDASRVFTITDFEAADALSIRHLFSQPMPPMRNRLSEYASLCARGKLEVPISKAYPFEQWRDAMKASMSRQARGKVLLDASIKS